MLKPKNDTAATQTPTRTGEALQLRWPSADVKAARLAAITEDYKTISGFMLACFHEHMKSREAELKTLKRQ
jgi:hypothetical protein